MSRRKKKKTKWWNIGFGKEQKIDTDKYSNTIAQHNKKLNSNGYPTNPDYHYDDFEDEQEVASPYKFDWGLERKLTDDTTKMTGAQRYDSAKQDFHNSYNSGYGWQGYDYYKKPQLSYKYVQQMANGLAAKNRITVKVGSTWYVDLLKKTLTYNPGSLIYGTKSELLATLMHEIGKLRYCEHISTLKNKYLEFYERPSKEVFSIFEDVRADYWMLKAYESASEIYDSAIPEIDKKVTEYRQFAKQFKDVLPMALDRLYTQIDNDFKDATEKGAAFQKAFGISNPQRVWDKIKEVKEKCNKEGNVYNYCAEMLRTMYDTENFADPTDEFDNIKELVEKTEDAIEHSKKEETSQQNVDLLSKEVFPEIEGLLRDFTADNEKIQEMFPDMADSVKQSISNVIKNALDAMSGRGGNSPKRGVNFDENGNNLVRSSGASEDIIPEGWAKGDYESIKESVQNEIKTLQNKLTFLKREEMSVKYQADQKRGKINSRKLYKHATGSKRVFKHKLPNLDTVQSFAFSVLVDTSGSMGGSRIIHTTRAVSIFAEVFKKMSIPFEVVAFDNGATVVKGFSQAMTKDIEQDIGGMVNKLGGSTNLDQGLDGLSILKQPEKNKVVIVLSDGGVGDVKRFDRDYFQPWKEKGVTSVGFGIECEEQMAQLCLGNSKVLDNASELPQEFTNLIKSLIKGVR